MAEIIIRFDSLDQYKAFLSDLKERGISGEEADALVVKHSSLEESLLKPSELNNSYDLEAIEMEVKEAMNQVYFGHRGRPDYSKAYQTGKCDAKTFQSIVFSYFQQLLEDKPEIVISGPTEGLTEEQKLYGAFVSYADYLGEGYYAMNNHRDDSEIGKKILHRIKNTTFTMTQHTHLAFSYAIGTVLYRPIKDKYDSNLTPEIINGPLKDEVIEKVRYKYNITD